MFGRTNGSGTKPRPVLRLGARQAGRRSRGGTELSTGAAWRVQGDMGQVAWQERECIGLGLALGLSSLLAKAGHAPEGPAGQAAQSLSELSGLLAGASRYVSDTMRLCGRRSCSCCSRGEELASVQSSLSSCRRGNAHRVSMPASLRRRSKLKSNDRKVRAVAALRAGGMVVSPVLRSSRRHRSAGRMGGRYREQLWGRKVRLRQGRPGGGLPRAGISAAVHSTATDCS